MVEVRAHPRRSRRGRPTWVAKHTRGPLTVRLMTPEMRLEKPNNLAGYSPEYLDVIFLGPRASEASPETLARVLGHESIHAAGRRIGEWKNESVDTRGWRARNEYFKHPELMTVDDDDYRATDVNHYVRAVMEPSGLYYRHARLRKSPRTATGTLE